MSKPFYRFCIFNGIGAILFTWAWWLGYVQQVFAGDVSHISYVISALFFLTLVRAFHDTAKANPLGYVEDVETWLVTMGLVGNVIGFCIALRGMDPSILSSVDGAQKVGAQLLEGMSVAFYSTLTGAILALWLSFARRVV